MDLFILFICFIVFLFVLYKLSKDDFVFLRKDLSVETVFNTAFLCAFSALLFARIFYIYFYPKEIYFSVLGFLVFPYFPGLSLTGAVLGGLLFLVPYSIYKKLPLGRLLDFLSISLLTSICLGTFVTLFIVPQNMRIYIGLEFVLFLLLLGIFLKFILSFLSRGRLKDGSVGLLFLIFFSVISFAGNLIKLNGLKVTPENIVLILILLVSLAVFAFREGKNKLNPKNE